MKYIGTILLCIFFQAMIGNNLKLSDLQYQDGKISFSIAWENSWNSELVPPNHDAVWVFFKIKQNNHWSHLDILVNANDFIFSSNELEIKIPADKKGFFVKKQQMGTGAIEATEITFPVNLDLESIESLKIFGIEMVYIPEGTFYLGDGVSYNALVLAPDNAPFLVTGEADINLSEEQISCLEAEQLPENIPQSFPKGFQGFYCMKYEISQQQYVDFLNTLTISQQTQLTSNSPFSAPGKFAMIEDGKNRNAIVIEHSAANEPAVYALNLNKNNLYNEADDGANLAANMLMWSDLAAYLDWAALRPMTEMEFEKNCRGENTLPEQGEFAWGTALIIDANTLVDAGTAGESVMESGNATSGLANHGYEGVQGPLRTGFAAKNNTTRVLSGASYYGCMEMSGNVWEQVISITTEGVVFSGNHGDGEIDENGFANQASWPDNTSAKGVGFKGGAWNSGIYEVGSFRDLAISDRFYINWSATLRRNTAGGRGVRSLNFAE